MYERLGGDHAVEKLATRVARAGDDRAVCVGSGIIERKRRDRSQHRIEPRAPSCRVRRIAMNAAFELNTRDDGHQDCIVQRSDAVRGCDVPVTQMDGDIGVEDIRHRQIPGRSGNSSSSRCSM